MPASIAGGLIGAALLLHTSAARFTALIPWLLLLACALLAAQESLRTVLALRIARNLGGSLRRLTGGQEKHPFNKRFQRLIAADSLEELVEQLRSSLPLLKREGIPIDFDQLDNDLRWFSRNPDRVKREWSGGFYVDPNALVATPPEPVTEEVQ